MAEDAAENVAEDETPTPAADELPSVITIDMLRKRMAEQKERQAKTLNFDDIKVPAELLGDYELGEEQKELEEEDDMPGDKRGKGKGKVAAKRPVAKRSKRRAAGFDDDESDFSFG